MITIIEMEILSFSLPESVLEKRSVNLTFESVKKKSLIQVACTADKT